MKKLFATTNIANKVRNTRLPRTKPLMPVFEIVSNSIHSIQESIKTSNLKKGEGKIIILCIRNGDKETLQELPEIDKYPIHSFEISDNGIGLNSENLTSFVEADTDHKLEIGGKGIGRFVCLKAFRVLNISSQFLDEQKKEKTIAFDFKATKEGFENFSEPKLNGRGLGTTVRLSNYKEEYKKI